MTFKPMGRKKPRKSPLPLKHVDPYLIHLSLGQTRLPRQTASGTNQPFCHSTLSRQTDRQTEWSRRLTCKNTRSHSVVLIESDVAKNRHLSNIFNSV